MSQLRSLFVLLMILLGSCMGAKRQPLYRVGIDPDFKTLELNGMEDNVYAFCNELFQEASHLEKVRFLFVITSWDILELGLEKREYQAMVSGRSSSLRRYESYDYSSLFLPTGTVLVVSKASEAKSLDDLSGKIVAVIEGSKGELLLESHPAIVIRSFPSIPLALNALEGKEADGALIPNLFAQHYVSGLFQKSLKIAGPPLTETGLRLIAPKERSPELLALFNRALKALQKEGKLEKLQRKWDLLKV